MNESYFDILGVERRYHLLGEELERRFHEKSRLLHPDRHVRADPQTRVRAALAASQLNQAYRTLKDPVRRAEYLLRLEGIDLSDERGGPGAAPEFLMEVMELRERLAEARSSGDREAVRSLADGVRARRDEAMAEADAGFTRYEGGGGDRAALAEVAAALVAERYFRRFLEEVEAFEEGVAGDGARE